MADDIIDAEAVESSVPAVRQGSPLAAIHAQPLATQPGQLIPEQVKHQTHNRVLNMRRYVPTEKEAAILGEAPPVKAILKMPYGNPPAIYLPHTVYRKLYNRAFGIGRWGTIPLLPPDAPFIKTETNKPGEVQVTVHYALIVSDEGEDKFIAEAWGSATYHDSNNAMDVGDALESAHSFCFARFGKDMGVYLDLWDKTFQRAWLNGDVVGQMDPHQKMGHDSSKPPIRTPVAAQNKPETQPPADDPKWRDGTVKHIQDPNNDKQPHKIILIDDDSGNEFEGTVFAKGANSKRVAAARQALDLGVPIRYLLGKSSEYNGKKSWFVDGLMIDADVLDHAMSTREVAAEVPPIHPDSTGGDELPF